MAINTMNTTLRHDILNLIAAAIDAGSAGGKIKIYTASFAALLATLTFSATAFGSPAAGAITAASITSGVAGATGTAAVVRVTDSNDAVVYQCTIGTSGQDITITNASIASGDTVTCSSFVLTAPAA